MGHNLGCVSVHFAGLFGITGMKFALMHVRKKTPRHIIFLIVSIVHYWTGQVKPQVQSSIALWLPVDMNAIPLASWHPDDLMEEEEMTTTDQGIS